MSIKSSNQKLYVLGLLCCLSITCVAADPVNLACTFDTVSNTLLTNIAGPQYGCNLEDDFPYIMGTTVAEVFGNHDGKELTDVTLLTINGKTIYGIPDLSAKFSELVYIRIIDTTLTYLKNSDLLPYKIKLQHLVVKNSGLEIIERGSFAEMTNIITIDLRGNHIFYIDPDVFQGLTLGYLLLEGVGCKKETVDIGNFESAIGTSLDDFIPNFKASTCATYNTANLAPMYQIERVKHYLSTTTSLGALSKQAGEIDILQGQLNTTNETLANVTSWYNEANSTISTLQSNVSSLTTSFEVCKTTSENLNSNLSALTLHAANLESQVEELELQAEKCLEVNGTCRFTNNTYGYSCIAHDISISSPASTERNIIWSGIHISDNLKDGYVEALIIRDLNVQYVPSGIGGTFLTLKTLVIRSCGLKKLSNKDFEDLNFIKTMEITLNNITSIDSKVFDDVSTIETLDLSENQIKSFPLRIFAQLTALNSLNLNKNQLTSVKTDFLPASSAVKFFSATYNQVGKVESSFVWKLRNAKLIDFTGNGCNKKFSLTDGNDYIKFYTDILMKC